MHLRGRRARKPRCRALPWNVDATRLRFLWTPYSENEALALDLVPVVAMQRLVALRVRQLCSLSPRQWLLGYEWRDEFAAALELWRRSLLFTNNAQLSKISRQCLLMTLFPIIAALTFPPDGVDRRDSFSSRASIDCAGMGGGMRQPNATSALICSI